MKHLLLLLFSCCFILSCGHSAEEKALMKYQLHNGGIKTTGTAILKYTVNEQGEIINENCDCGATPYSIPYSIYVVNGCEYIEFGNGHGTWGGHSGTCPNPIHQYKPDQILTDTSKINF